MRVSLSKLMYCKGCLFEGSSFLTYYCPNKFDVGRDIKNNGRVHQKNNALPK